MTGENGISISLKDMRSGDAVAGVGNKMIIISNVEAS